MESYLKEEPSYQSLEKRNSNKMPLIQKGKAFCNYFPLKVLKLEDIYIFSIELVPHIPVEKFGLRYRVLSLLEIQIARVINKPVITGFEIYSHHEPKVNEKVFQSGEYKVQVKLKSIVKVSQNVFLLKKVLESFMRGVMIKKNFNLLNKSHKYFNMKNKVQHYAVNVYSGYHIDFVKSQKLFYLRIDSTRKIVSSQTALDAIQYYHRACRADREGKRKFIRQQMIGRTVMANYGKNRFFKIKNVEFKILEEQRIEDHKPLIQYYEEKYGINIKTPTQPLLVVEDKRLQKQKKKCYLIPELCFMIGLPDDIQEVKQRNILTAMKLQPQESRLQAIQMMEDLSQETEDWKNLEKLGIFLETKQMPLIEYKKFPKPIISLGSKLSVQRGLETLFNIACRPIYDGSHQVQCTIVHFARANLTGIQQIFQKNAQNIGVSISFQKFEIGQISNKALVQIEASISKICQQSKMSENNKNYKKTNFLLLILPNSLKVHYRKIKKICLINYEILSQLVFESTLNHRHNLTIFGKILLQIIAKMGNILWSPQQIFETERKIILIAFSTSRVSSQTILSTCCTINQTYQVGFSCVDFCSQNNEKSNDLLEIMIKGSLKCLQKFKKVNNVLPDQIIFISKAGNLSIGDHVLKQKYIQGLWIEINEFYEQEKEFCMTYILIETKDNSKFFIFQNVHTKARNAEIGTFFDKNIVQKNQFLLITHATPGVSAMPIRFKILTSDSNLQKSLIQQLLFNQCFNYANHTGLVQTPAILQYAKKCAKFRAQAPFEEQLSEQIEELPYYL